MIEFVPYFAGLITLIFSVAMFLAIKTKDDKR